MSPRIKSTLHRACIISALLTLDVLTLDAVRLCQFKFAQHYKPKQHTYRLQMSQCSSARNIQLGASVRLWRDARFSHKSTLIGLRTPSTAMHSESFINVHCNNFSCFN